MNNLKKETPENNAPLVKIIVHSWFKLTSEEQKAVLIILALFLVGVAARFWHLCLR